MSGQLDPADEALLQSALSSSFTHLPPAPVPEPAPAAAAPAPAPQSAPSAAVADAGTSAEDSAKEEYERHLAEWRAESAVAREKAERVRAEYEARRNAEGDDTARKVADEALLQATLSSSFTHLPAAPAPEPAPVAAAVAPAPEPAQPAPVPSAAVSSDDSAKEEYERHLAAWRAESAVAREKAERVRAEWELRRQQEEQEAASQKSETPAAATPSLAASVVSGWETVSVPGAPAAGGTTTLDESITAQRVGAAQAAAHNHELKYGKEVSPEASPADARDLVSGEVPRTGAVSGLPFPRGSPPVSRSSHLFTADSETYVSEDDDHRQQWEEVPSLASSYPSLIDHTSTPASQPGKGSPKSVPQTGEKHHEHHHDDSHHKHHDHHKAAPPPSMTLSVFSPGLSPRARTLALISSLAINMFLPFVNGMMLGFGEIFAKSVIAPILGIKIPSVAGIGIRAATLDRNKR